MLPSRSLFGWLDFLRPRRLHGCVPTRRPARGRRRGTVLAPTEVLEVRLLPSAQPTIVKDIEVGGCGSDPARLHDSDGTLFFTGEDGTSGMKLWKSDGTAAGTTLVKSIGSDFDYGAAPDNFTDANGVLFFTAGGTSEGIELWKTHGTAAGTVLVKDVWPGYRDSFPSNLVNLGARCSFPRTTGHTATSCGKATALPLERRLARTSLQARAARTASRT